MAGGGGSLYDTIVDCMLGYDADMMTVEYCRGFQ